MFSNIIEIIVLSFVQGISEFLPISSSAHLIVVSTLYEFKSNSLLIDVSLHLGSLFAIIFFFKKEIFNLRNNQKILSLILFGSIPLFIVGYILYKTDLIYILRDIKIIAWTTLVFGIVLYFADKNKFDRKISSNLNLKTILYIGLFQILALIPGTSRSGITITVARLTGMERPSAARFSMLLGIPTIIAAGALEAWELFQFKDTEVTNTVFLAAGFSFVSALATISVMMLWLRKFSFTPFVIYRIILGALILSIPHV